MSTKKAALLLIDLQREFLTHTGFFKKPVQMSNLLEPLSILVEAARQAGHEFIWIKSHYPEREHRPEPLRPARPAGERHASAPMNSDMLASGHAGRPCCVEGSEGARYPDPILAMQHEADTHLVKTRYSAFGETGLAEMLRARGVEEVFVGGVVTNVCVRATVTDAFFLGFDVTVVSDCVAATRANLHREALAVMEKWYARVEPCVLALTRWGSVRRGLGAGDTSVHYGVLPASWDEEGTLFEQVADEVAWLQMRHRGGVVPRLVALQGEVGEDGTVPMYRHPADEQPTLEPFSPWIEKLEAHAERLLDQPLNHVLIQRYADGLGYISPHSDKTLDIARGSAIVGLSLGATRAIILQSKRKMEDGKPLTQVLELPHGSLFVLGWETNQRFMHGIRQDRRAEQDKRADEMRDGGERISLTMRHVATFLTPDGVLYGQGATRKHREEASPFRGNSQAREEQAARMLAAFGAENMSDSFDWDVHYGEGFDVIDLGALRDTHDEENGGEEG